MSQYPYVLVASEKHDDRSFLVSDLEQEERTFLHLAKERWSESWYCDPGDPNEAPYSEEDLDKLREIDDKVWRLAAHDVSEWKRKHKFNVQFKQNYEDIKTAVATGNGKLAMDALLWRSDRRFECETLRILRPLSL